MCRDDGKRPDGVTEIPWQRGKFAAWDFTCVDNFAQSHRAEALSGELAAAAEDRKRAKYTSLSYEYVFMPICITTLGEIGPSANNIITTIADKIEEETKQTQCKQQLIQRLQIAIQLGNATSIENSTKLANELFF